MSHHKSDIWFISDTHFQHENILKYSPDRASRWLSAKEMDAADPAICNTAWAAARSGAWAPLWVTQKKKFKEMIGETE